VSLNGLTTERPKNEEEDGGRDVANQRGAPNIDSFCRSLLQEERSNDVEDATGQWEEEKHLGNLSG